MIEHSCKICKQNFSHLNPKSGWALKRLFLHIRKQHLLSKRDYIINYYFNGEEPKCKCGCGNSTTERKGLLFNIYYKDHVRYRQITSSEKDRRKLIAEQNLKKKNGSLKNINRNTIEEMWNKFKSDPLISLRQISKEYNIDTRTFKRLLIYNKIVSQDLLLKLAKESQSQSSSLKRKFEFVKKDLLEKAYSLIKNLPDDSKQISPTELNKTLGTNYSFNTWYKRLHKAYGTDISSLLSNGRASKEELDLLHIFRFYFKNVQSNIYLEGVYYDFCINNRLLVEYDGEYWHQNKKEQDLYKTKLAEVLGYQFYRISRTTSKNFDHLIKIKEILQNDFIQTSNKKLYST